MANERRATRKTATQDRSLILQLKDAFDNGTAEEKTAIREMFPGMKTEEQKVVVDRTSLSLDEQLALARASKGKKQETTSAQMIVMTMGSVTHPPGWEPQPPEHVSELGEEAERLWLLRWHQGKAGGSMEAFRRELGNPNAHLGEQTVDTLEANADIIGGVQSGEAPLGLVEADSYLSMANDTEAAAEAAGVSGDR